MSWIFAGILAPLMTTTTTERRRKRRRKRSGRWRSDGAGPATAELRSWGPGEPLRPWQVQTCWLSKHFKFIKWIFWKEVIGNKVLGTNINMLNVSCFTNNINLNTTTLFYSVITCLTIPNRLRPPLPDWLRTHSLHGMWGRSVTAVTLLSRGQRSLLFRASFSCVYTRFLLSLELWRSF